MNVNLTVDRCFKNLHQSECTWMDGALTKGEDINFVLNGKHLSTFSRVLKYLANDSAFKNILTDLL